MSYKDHARTILEFGCDNAEFLKKLTGKTYDDEDAVFADSKEICGKIEKTYFTGCKTLLKADRITKNVIKSLIGGDCA